MHRISLIRIRRVRPISRKMCNSTSRGVSCERYLNQRWYHDIRYLSSSVSAYYVEAGDVFSVIRNFGRTFYTRKTLRKHALICIKKYNWLQQSAFDMQNGASPQGLRDLKSSRRTCPLYSLFNTSWILICLICFVTNLNGSRNSVNMSLHLYFHTFPRNIYSGIPLFLYLTV